MLALLLWPGAGLAAPSGWISPNALAEIRGLEQEKAARTPAQRKMDSNLVHARRRQLTGVASAAAPRLQSDVRFEPDGLVLVDITATVTDDLLAFIGTSGGHIINSFAQYSTILASVPLPAIESVAARPDVRFVARAHTPSHNVSNVDAEGDVCHAANLARATFGADGTGIKVGVISDDDQSNTVAVAQGNLPGNVITLSGQGGTTHHSEGTAMLELIYRLAPGAQLYFATDEPSEAQGATNILALAAADRRANVDDVIYSEWYPFQRGQPLAQAKQTVYRPGRSLFSSGRHIPQ